MYLSEDINKENLEEIIFRHAKMALLKNLNIPASVSLLSGDRKPQIRS